MTNMKTILKHELTNWKLWEISWLIFCILSITLLSLYWNDTLIGMISAITGITYVVCIGKGNISAYFFGIVNCVLYSLISFEATLYGEVLLNAGYYLPMMFVGIFLWRKNIDHSTNEISKRRMAWHNRMIGMLVILALSYLLGLCLQSLGDAMPFVDAFTTVASIIAMIATVKMYSEQWWIWLFVNMFSVYMWYCDFQAGSDNIATLVMWGIYLINAIIMLFKWESESKRYELSFTRTTTKT
ncbi:MAG: nicotinamide mononucleotide transporter [Selenomonadales bacterium]|nr:nicotinamide mononucleotide transporter [Selenomonadales bacterium]